MKLFIGRGADVNAVTADNCGPNGKNGPIALGRLTPLMFAASSGKPEIVRMLLEARADVNARDIRGMTPLMLAVANDYADEASIRMLLAGKPALDVKSNAGETALDWSAKFRNPSVLAAVRAAGHSSMKPRVQPVIANARRDLRAAIRKSVELLQKSSGVFFKEGGCYACHAQNITIAAVAAARRKSIDFDRAAAEETIRGMALLDTAFAEGWLQRLDLPAVQILTYALFFVSFEGVATDRISDSSVHNIAAQQNADGSWTPFGSVRPPIFGGALTETALAIRALRDYAMPARAPEMRSRIERAAQWLMLAQPSTTEDAVMQLLGAVWAGVEQGATERMAKELLVLQRADGGWAQTRYLDSDAYATGTALYALKQAAIIRETDPPYRRGVNFLLRTQAADGSWFVASRAPKFQPYFAGGFPYGQDSWISQMATGWATIALSYAIQEAAPGRATTAPRSR